MKTTLCFVGIVAFAEPLGPTVTIAPGVEMPSLSLGTCCGSKPSVGLADWLKAGGVGIDSAWNYHTQEDIGKILKDEGVSRESVFITSKLPGGDSHNASDCHEDPSLVVWYAQENLRQLGVDYMDLLLLHRPCDQTNNGLPSPFLTPPEARRANAALWEGMQQVLAMNLTRAIGVSNYNHSHLEALRVDVPGPMPAINQCHMGVGIHDDATIAYCEQRGIRYQAYSPMKACPFTDSRITSMASSHNVTAAQVCLRYVLDKGVVLAVGTGKNASKTARYAEEDLDVFGFSLTEEEVGIIDAISGSSASPAVV